MKNGIFIATTIAFVFFLNSQKVQAQKAISGVAKTEKIQSYRIAFITEKLHLTTDEAQRFWPLYNEYKEKQRTQRHSAVVLAKNVESMTDTDAEQYITDIADAEQKGLNLRKEYFQKMKSILPIKKVAMLVRVEHDFKEEMLNRVKQKK